MFLPDIWNHAVHLNSNMQLPAGPSPFTISQIKNYLLFQIDNARHGGCGTLGNTEGGYGCRQPGGSQLRGNQA